MVLSSFLGVFRILVEFQLIKSKVDFFVRFVSFVNLFNLFIVPQFRSS